MTNTCYHFHSFQNLNTPLSLKVGNTQTVFRILHPLHSDYIDYFFQPLFLRIHRMPPVTSCLLVSPQYFPCGTHIASILQEDNCVFIGCVQHFCFYLYLNYFKYKNHCRRCGCTCYSWYLLSTLEYYTFLFSSAKTTHFLLYKSYYFYYSCHTIVVIG